MLMFRYFTLVSSSLVQLHIMRSDLSMRIRCGLSTQGFVLLSGGGGGALRVTTAGLDGIGERGACNAWYNSSSEDDGEDELEELSESNGL